MAWNLFSNWHLNLGQLWKRLPRMCTSKSRIFNQCRNFFILHQFWPAFNASKLQVTLLFWHGSGGGRGAKFLCHLMSPRIVGSLVPSFYRKLSKAKCLACFLRDLSPSPTSNPPNAEKHLTLAFDTENQERGHLIIWPFWPFVTCCIVLSRCMWLSALDEGTTWPLSVISGKTNKRILFPLSNNGWRSKNTTLTHFSPSL